jgi:hypothetical protein
MSDCKTSLARFEAHVLRLPTASVHDINPVLGLVSQAHSLLRSQVEISLAELAGWASIAAGKVLARNEVMPMTKTHSTITECQAALAEFERLVRRLPTASVHDVGTLTGLIGQLHSRLRSEVGPLVVDPADADPRILAGVESHLGRVA